MSEQRVSEPDVPPFWKAAEAPRSAAAPASTDIVRPRRVALIGAGNIAATHAEALSTISGVSIAAMIDPNMERARQLAKRWKVDRVYPSWTELAGDTSIDAVHILTPPGKHADAALAVLDQVGQVLIEKPLASTAQSSADMLLAFRSNRTFAYVNHNFVFHPAFQRLLKLIQSGEYGRVAHIDCTYRMPLRQLAAGQFQHWMFQRSANLLLEQAVHPFAQVLTLTGQVKDKELLPGRPFETPDRAIVTRLGVMLNGTSCSAQIDFEFGATFPVWTVTAQCSDGVVHADMVRNLVVPISRGHRIEPLDNYLQTRRAVRSATADTWSSALNYGLSLVRLKGRADPFYLSMRSSIAAFHGQSALEMPWVNRPDGAHAIVELCEDLGSRADRKIQTSPSRAHISTGAATASDVVVLGGTGFIGRAVVKQLVAEGAAVTVVARSIGDQSDAPPGTRWVQADVSRMAELSDLLEGARVVVNAATPAISEDWPETLAATAGQIDALTQACLTGSPKHLIHLGSTAALYLGSSSARITGATAPDPRSARRSMYARAKAAADVMLLQRNHDRGLPVCILRPGIVVGEGGTPYHSGVGLFVNEQHCIGWNMGLNPLPFVLVEDVASAVAAACRRPQLDGPCYNIIGDVRLTAREYIAELASALNRPIHFHPKMPQQLYVAELAKWSVKRVGGRQVPLPSYRDLRSRGFSAFFDCSDTKRDLGWKPQANRDAFIQHGLRVHATANLRS